MLIKEYELIRAPSDEELSRKVTDKLQGGWELYGNPYSTTMNYSAHQAVVKRGKE